MKLNHGAYILARYSTDNQEQDSIEVQVEKCAKWCADNHIPVLDIFADYAVSGMKDTRPQYLRMMELLKQGGADTVVIYDQSRMFRKMTAWFQFRDDLENLGARVVSVTQPMIGGSLSDPSNFLMEGSMALFNQMWVLQTRQKVVEKMRFMARNGSFTGGTPAFGYKVVEGRLAIDEKEANIVQRIFSMYADGVSYRKITEVLNSEGITTRKGTPFGATTIHDLLKNKKYIGILTYGKTLKNPDGTRNSHKIGDNVIEVEDGCPAIIEQSLFDLVQRKMESRRRTGGQTPKRKEFALRNKVFCGDCQSPMNLHYSGRGQKYAYYECTAQKRTHICENKPVKAPWIEKTIADAIRQMMLEPKNKDHLMQILRTQRNSVMGGAGGRMEELAKKRKEISTKLENATNAILQGLTSKALIERVHGLENEKASIDYQMEQLKKEVTRSQLSDQDIEKALDQIISTVYQNDSAILSIVYRVEVYKDRIKVWTIMDCDPTDKNKKPISILPQELPDVDFEFSQNCSTHLTGTTSYTQIIIGFLLRRT